MQCLLPMPSRTLPVPQPDVGTLLAPHFPCQSSQADIFAKELVYRQTRLLCFPASAYLLQITRVSACPRATSQALTTDTSLRLVAASRGQTLALLREAQPSPANTGTGMFRPGSGHMTPVEEAEGWDLPPFGKSKRPQAPAGTGSLRTVGMVQANGSCSPVTPAHRFHVLPVPAQRS